MLLPGSQTEAEIFLQTDEPFFHAQDLGDFRLRDGIRLRRRARLGLTRRPFEK